MGRHASSALPLVPSRCQNHLSSFEELRSGRNARTPVILVPIRLQFTLILSTSLAVVPVESTAWTTKRSVPVGSASEVLTVEPFTE
jgi:hypothetical protein